jgi:prolycopene isomerase
MTAQTKKNGSAVEPHRAVVIGTGIGGSGLAAQLAQAGFNVTVLERNAFAGGKTAAYTRDGFTMDIAIHLSPRCEKGPIGELARRVQADLTFMHKTPELKLIMGTRACRLPLKFWTPLPILKAEWAFRFSPLIAKGLLKFGLKVIRVKTIADVKPYEGMSAAELIQSDIKDPKLAATLDVMASLMLELSTQEASAADFLWSLANWFKDAKSGYPKGGYGRVACSFLEVCERHGGTIKLGEEARRIRIEDGRVTGVQTDGAFYPADIVASNAGYKKTLHLAGLEHFDADFVAYAEALKDSQGAVVVQYALDRQYMHEMANLYIPEGFNTDTFLKSVWRGHAIETPHLYIVSPTVMDPTLAPPGKHIVNVGTIVPADLAVKEATAQVLDLIEETMERLFPNLKAHTLWKVRRNIDFFAALGGRGAAEAIGLGQRFNQDGKNKPDPRMPVKGLYAVGADAGGTGIGTEMAAESAINVFNIIMRDIESGTG